jgi:26S proteasome regulatory subunit N10
MSLAEANAAQPSSSAAASTSHPAEASDSSSSVQMPDSLTAPISNANESSTAVPPASGDQSADMIDLQEEGEDEDEELRRAIAMSRGENPDDDVVMADDGEGDDEEDEEAAMARAIQMSLEEGKDQEGK